MDKLASYLINDKIYWYQSLFSRNLFARGSVFYCFMLEGIFMGVWSCFLPHIQDSLKLSDSKLGLAVLFVYLGTVLVSPLTAFCLRQLGSKLSTYLGAICFGISLCFIAFADSFGVLILTMFIYGSSMGIMDISMNSSAILTEIVAGKPLLGSFHGSYSVAAAMGSLIGGALVGANFGIEAVFVSFSVVSVVLTTLWSMNMYNFKQEEVITRFGSGHHVGDDGETDTAYSALLINAHDEESSSSSSSAAAAAAAAGETTHRPFSAQYTHLADTVSTKSNSPPVSPSNKGVNDEVSPAALVASRWTIAFYSMVGFLAAFGESSIVTWSIVYFDRSIHASSVMKSLGFTSFMVSMAVGRFSCDYLRRVVGRRLIVRVSGVLAAGGLTLAVVALDMPCSIAFACIGFSITGLGLFTLIPTVFSSAGHIPGVHAGSSIATVAGFSYSGSIVSSPLVGLLSDAFGSLRYALLCDAILLAIICPLSWGVPEESHVYRTTASSSGDEQTSTKELHGVVQA